MIAAGLTVSVIYTRKKEKKKRKQEKTNQLQRLSLPSYDSDTILQQISECLQQPAILRQLSQSSNLQSIVKPPMQPISQSTNNLQYQPASKAGNANHGNSFKIATMFECSGKVCKDVTVTDFKEQYLLFSFNSDGTSYKIELERPVKSIAYDEGQPTSKCGLIIITLLLAYCVN